MRKSKISVIVFCIALLAVLATGYVQAEDVTVVPVNTTVSKVGTERQYDLYQVDLPGTGKLNVELSHANLFSTDVYWTVDVLAADMETELLSFDSIGTDEYLVGPSLGLTAGTYYVKVYSRKECSHAYSDTPYYMKPRFEISDSWEIEYNATTKNGNDSQGGSTTMQLGKNEYGTIRNSSDVDFFRFSVPSNGTLTVTFKHPNVYNSKSCWKVDLVNAKTESVCSIESLGTKKSYSTPQIGVSGGTYYIKVAKGDETDTSDYSIYVKFKKASNWEQEYSDTINQYNNNANHANSITRKTAVYGSISDEGDSDYFKISLKSAGTVKINFSHKYVAKKKKFWTVTVYNSKIKQQYVFYSRGVDKSLTKKLRLKKGTYFIKISKGAYWRFDPYKLKVS